MGKNNKPNTSNVSHTFEKGDLWSLSQNTVIFRLDMDIVDSGHQDSIAYIYHCEYIECIAVFALG